MFQEQRLCYQHNPAMCSLTRSACKTHRSRCQKLSHQHCHRIPLQSRASSAPEQSHRHNKLLQKHSRITSGRRHCRQGSQRCSRRLRRTCQQRRIKHKHHSSTGIWYRSSHAHRECHSAHHRTPQRPARRMHCRACSAARTAPCLPHNCPRTKKAVAVAVEGSQGG